MGRVSMFVMMFDGMMLYLCEMCVFDLLFVVG